MCSCVVLNRLLDGFEGKLTSSKWATLTKVSQATAARDIEDLVQRHVLQKGRGGRAKHQLFIARIAAPHPS